MNARNYVLVFSTIERDFYSRSLDYIHNFSQLFHTQNSEPFLYFLYFFFMHYFLFSQQNYVVKWPIFVAVNVVHVPTVDIDTQIMPKQRKIHTDITMVRNHHKNQIALIRIILIIITIQVAVTARTAKVIVVLAAVQIPIQVHRLVVVEHRHVTVNLRLLMLKTI